MKIDENIFRNTDRSVRDALDQVTLILNNGKVSAQVVTSPPTWLARNGEFAFLNSAGALRIYFYASNQWNFLAGSPTGSTDPPIGTIIMYATSSAPTGWLLCDSSSVSRVTYANLFDVIGGTYGTGDGSTTFTLPDMRSRFPIGQGQGAGLTNRIIGVGGGAETIDISHTHLQNMGGNAQGGQTVVIGAPSGDNQNILGLTGLGVGNNIVNTGVATSLSATQSIMDPFRCVNYIIKV